MHSRLSFPLTIIFSVLLALSSWLHWELVKAASLTSMSDTLSSTVALATGVTHTIGFTTGTTDNLKQVDVQFSTTVGGSTKPAALSLTSATLGSITGLGTGWNLVTSSVAAGIISINRASAGNVASATAATIDFSTIINSAIDDCQPSNDILQDTCNVAITTYSDDGSTVVDTGDTTYTVAEDPSLTFEVQDVTTGQTHNGVTSNINTSSTTIAFGHLAAGTLRYGTQKLTIYTNAPHGYVVYARLAIDWQGGSDPTGNFDPFAASGVSWGSPHTWSSPTGVVSNVDTGWFGANTSDTRVSGWSSASGKFGPIGQTREPVAYSTVPDRSGSVIYVSYAVEVNAAQPSDAYTASIVYDIQPTF